MKKLFILGRDKLLSSYWFYPAALFALSFIMAYVTIELDYRMGPDFRRQVRDFMFFNDLSMDTARIYLSTLVGAVITVVGVVFSLTILAVSSASNQFGPRTLGNFMRDKSNQITLGVFTSTFVYCSTVLLSLYEREGMSFIPYLSLFVSYALALTSVGFLIFYIHHIPQSLRIETIMNRVAKQALQMIERPFPFFEGVDAKRIEVSDFGAEEEQALRESAVRECCKGKAGYVQAVDIKELARVAQKADAFFVIAARPGDFLNGAGALFYSDKELGKPLGQAAAAAFAVGEARTQPQNLMYQISQLMEIAVRAMSPGLNDPVTAMSCVDWLEACLIKLMEREEEGDVIILDEDNNPRILVKPVGTLEVLYYIRRGLSEHMASQLATSAHFMDSLARLSKISTSPERQKALRACGAELLAFGKRKSLPEAQMQRLAETFSSLAPNHLKYPHGYQ